MALTVRLDDTLAAALVRCCAATGAAKRLVVQESLARYLLGDQADAASPRGAVAQPPAAPSANDQAFAYAGFVSAGVWAVARPTRRPFAPWPCSASPAIGEPGGTPARPGPAARAPPPSRDFFHAPRYRIP